MAKEMQWHEAAREVTYIQSINPSNPGLVFNHDPECFARYRKMQSDHARKSGHDLQADQMMMTKAWMVPSRIEGLDR
jgi:hypothetical protein